MKTHLNLVLCALLFFCVPVSLHAEPQAAVPAEFKDLYRELESLLDRFNRTLDRQKRSRSEPLAFSAELLSANSHRGPQLLKPEAYKGITMELDRFKELGLQAVTVSLGFPLLYPKFHKDKKTYEAYLGFYEKLAEDIRSRGMKLIVETGAIFSQGGYADPSFDMAGFYRSLSLADYIKGRSEMAVIVASRLKPDFLCLGAEPDTESRQSGQPLNTPKSFTRLVNSILAALGEERARTITVGAGIGSWQRQYITFAWELAKNTRLDFIDIHIYPVNMDFLDRVFTITGIARTYGKAVASSEAWLYKSRTRELGRGIPDTEFFSRDAFSFWEPLDKKFLETIVRLARFSGFRFLSPFWSKYFYAYLDYSQYNGLEPAQLIRASAQDASQGIAIGEFTGLAKRYSELIASGKPSLDSARPDAL
jgi:hypothetical protein